MAERSLPARNLRFVISTARFRFRRLVHRGCILLPLAGFMLLLVLHVSGPSFNSTDYPSASPTVPPLTMVSVPRKASSRINVADFPDGVRARLFGVFQEQFPLNERETTLERAWRAKMMAFQADTKDCNHFIADENSYAVLKLASFTVSVKPASNHSEGEDHVRRLLDSGGFHVQPGGSYSPPDCAPRETVAVVIPYRDRFENLLTFLNYMHRYLQRQRRRYLLVVAEQANFDASFNRAKLFNAAVRELLKEENPRVDCFVLHDVDKVPYHLFNLYSCGFQPRQLATMSWNSSSGAWLDYYASFFGGVTAFSRWHLLRMNGVSNIFYGWGAEDDDMYGRSILAGFLPSYPSKYVGRMWVMGHHDDMKLIVERHEMLWTDKIAHRMLNDGLWQATYKLTLKVNRPLYTKLSFIV